VQEQVRTKKQESKGRRDISHALCCLDLTLSAALACHVSKCGIFYQFSPFHGKVVSTSVKVLSEESPLAIMVKS
jgi:hypothetical protein